VIGNPEPEPEPEPEPGIQTFFLDRIYRIDRIMHALLDLYIRTLILSITDDW